MNDSEAVSLLGFVCPALSPPMQAVKPASVFDRGHSAWLWNRTIDLYTGAAL